VVCQAFQLNERDYEDIMTQRQRCAVQIIHVYLIY